MSNLEIQTHRAGALENPYDDYEENVGMNGDNTIPSLSSMNDLNDGTDNTSLLHEKPLDSSSEPINEQVQEESNEEQDIDEQAPKTWKEKLKFLWQNMRSELPGIFEIAWPTILMNISNKILGMEDIAFIGHLGNEDYLAASALANAIYFCMSFISIGLINGQDTLVSQVRN